MRERQEGQELQAEADRLYQQVLWLDVSVHDVDAVQVLERPGQVVHHDGGVSLGVFGRGGDGVKQVSSLRKVRERSDTHRGA